MNKRKGRMVCLDEIPTLPENLYSLKGEPHESWGGWKNFLTRACLIRDAYQSVVWYGVINCNYIVAPCGMVVCNYGSNGRALMSVVREKGLEVFYQMIGSGASQGGSTSGTNTQPTDRTR